MTAEFNRGLSPLQIPGRHRRLCSIPAIILAALILSWLLRPFIRILSYPHREYSALLEEEIRHLENQGIPLTAEELNLSEIPDEENGALVFRKIFALMDELSEKYPEELRCLPVFQGQWEEASEEKKERVSKLLLKGPEFAEVFRLVEKAVNMRQRFYPEKYYENSRMIEEKLFPEMVSEMAKFRALQRVLMSKAKLEAEYGDMDEAFAAILLGLKTARASSTDVPVMLTQLMRFTQLHISLAALDKITGLDEVSAESYRGIIGQIEKEKGELLIYPALKNEIFLVDIQQSTFHTTDIKQITDRGKWARRAAERISPPHADEAQIKSMVSSFESMAEQTMEEIRNIYPGLTSGDVAVLRKYPEKLRLVLLQTRRRVVSIMKEPGHDALEELKELKKELKESPSIENAIALLWLSNITRVCRQEVVSRACLGAAKIGMANILYHRKHDEYASELSRLAPEFLRSLPLDLFTGRDYIYRRKGEGFIVYSVGGNLTDDGGVHSLVDGDIVREVD